MKKLKSAHPFAERWGSLGLAVCLHGAIVLAFIFSSASKPPKFDLDMPMINLTTVTIGSAGPRDTAKKPVVTQNPEPTQAKPEPAPKAENATPVPKIENITPEPVPEAKPEPKPEAEVKPEPKPEPKPAPPSDEDILKAAFADAQKTAKPQPKVSGGASVLDQALSEALAESKKPGAGGIITGADGDGIGYLGTYRDSVESRIRQHLTAAPSGDHKQYFITVVLNIADDGTITQVTVKEPSTSAAFDARVMRAIKDAGKMEPPRRNDVKKLEIMFTSVM